MLVLFRAITFATIFVALLLIYVPANLLSWSGIVSPTTIDVQQVVGVIVGTIGIGLAIWCVLVFALVGEGTPAPFDPPRKLVIRGPYRFVRNPMYVGAGLALAGASLYYESWSVFAYAGVFLVLSHAFVVLYEEPTLRRTYEQEYEEYCRRVRRWLPTI
jgi:protein-S-isoprenylcysteine O-methyltransferase Ste14